MNRATSACASSCGKFRVVPKSDDAVAAGSVGPWQPGGISPFQERCGQEVAERERRPYESYGAASSGVS